MRWRAAHPGHRPITSTADSATRQPATGGDNDPWGEDLRLLGTAPADAQAAATAAAGTTEHLPTTVDGDGSLMDFGQGAAQRSAAGRTHGISTESSRTLQGCEARCREGRGVSPPTPGAIVTRTAEPSTSGSTPLSSNDATSLHWLVAAAVVVILNETAMVNALPRLMADFAVSARTAQWLTTAFMLTMAVVIPATGWFLQRVSTRRALTVAMTAFGVGTMLCAVAPAFHLLVAGRVVQAAGTAVVMPLLMTTFMQVVPPDQRGRVMGRVTMAISVAPALGPAVSGLVLGVASWRWTFALVLVVAVGVTGQGLRRLPNLPSGRSTRLDGLSLALAALGFGPLVYGFSQLGAPDGPPPAVGLAVGAAGLMAFVVRQVRLQREDAALLDLRCLAHRSYRLGVATLAIAFMTMIGALVLLSIYLQAVRGLSALQSGLLVLPGGLAMGLLGPRVGRISDRFGARRLVVPGAAGVPVVLLALSRLSDHAPVPIVLVLHVLLMTSLAAVFTPLFSLSLGALPPHLYPHGSALLASMQQLAAALGTALVVSVLTWRGAALAARGLGDVESRLGGTRMSFAVSALVAMVVLALALSLPRATTPTRAPAAQDDVP
jgi:DHA2 family lincomycin resistance protein-like MFS transporter